MFRELKDLLNSYYFSEFKKSIANCAYKFAPISNASSSISKVSLWWGEFIPFSSFLIPTNANAPGTACVKYAKSSPPGVFSYFVTTSSPYNFSAEAFKISDISWLLTRGGVALTKSISASAS